MCVNCGYSTGGVEVSSLTGFETTSLCGWFWHCRKIWWPCLRGLECVRQITQIAVLWDKNPKVGETGVWGFCWPIFAPQSDINASKFRAWNLSVLCLAKNKKYKNKHKSKVYRCIATFLRVKLICLIDKWSSYRAENTVCLLQDGQTYIRAHT